MGFNSGFKGLSVRSTDVKQPGLAADISATSIGEVKIEKPNVLLSILQDIHTGVFYIIAFIKYGR